MVHVRTRSIGAALALLVVAGIVSPVGAAAAGDEVTAYLDGKRIPTADIGRYHCDDFAYPVIRCSVTAVMPRVRSTVATLLSSADYVTIYDGINFAGPSMTMSQDYSALLTIGWNDRASSFRGRNSATGKFWSDWMMGGTYTWFCCNQQVSSLGAANNTFSSVQRT
jgi:hypothetical protein